MHGTKIKIKKMNITLHFLLPSQISYIKFYHTFSVILFIHSTLQKLLCSVVYRHFDGAKHC
jgi:hypothetical protein